LALPPPAILGSPSSSTRTVSSMHIRTVVIAPLALLLGGARAGLAQAPHIAPRASVVFAQDAAAASPTALSSGILGDGSTDYRYTGFWIGTGTAVGLTFVGLASCGGMEGGCNGDTGEVALGVLIFTATMGLVGALVGAQFNK
jgi:hypothetical protein